MCFRDQHCLRRLIDSYRLQGYCHPGELRTKRVMDGFVYTDFAATYKGH